MDFEAIRIFWLLVWSVLAGWVAVDAARRSRRKYIIWRVVLSD